MLDQKDLMAIAELINVRAEQTEDKLGKRIDTRVEQAEKRLSEEMDDKICQSEKRLGKEIDDKICQSEKRISEQMDTRISQSEEFLFDEMERYDKKYQKEFDNVKKRLGIFEGYYRMIGNENETLKLSLKLIGNLDQRVSKLEARAV